MKHFCQALQIPFYTRQTHCCLPTHIVSPSVLSTDKVAKRFEKAVIASSELNENLFVDVQLPWKQGKGERERESGRERQQKKAYKREFAHLC